MVYARRVLISSTRVLLQLGREFGSSKYIYPVFQPWLSPEVVRGYSLGASGQLVLL